MKWEIQGKGPIKVRLFYPENGTDCFEVRTEEAADFLEWGRSFDAAIRVIQTLFMYRSSFLEKNGVKDAAQNLYQLEAEITKAQRRLMEVERIFWKWTDLPKESVEKIEKRFSGNGDVFVQFLGEVVHAAILSEDDRKNSLRGPGDSKAPEPPRTAKDAEASSGTTDARPGPDSSEKKSRTQIAKPVPGS